MASACTASASCSRSERRMAPSFLATVASLGRADLLVRQAAPQRRPTLRELTQLPHARRARARIEKHLQNFRGCFALAVITHRVMRRLRVAARAAFIQP